ncbi:gamma-glutamylcyclotransferase family protein [Burkholderia sp. Bp9142]|uniref:gamma-glutamylcyclotransferase family protein n=1 Tax=Burkholderia sp. Bp9142 TaxID=2184573 RepID=UPI000F5B25CB|nr:gamma-glutamylcyclotransferase family protein [Burkholderia sp. Bp9142]RQR26174.1 gamma-glutamylcyclotransferase [Burkholderia sp. Bp9142]
MLNPNEFLYFAYGSNMSVERLVTRSPSARVVATGFLTGYRLVFDKFSRKDGSGKCDCEKTDARDDRVYGVLYAVTDTDRHALDEAEGAGFGYDSRHVDVETEQGMLPADTYIATNKQPGLHSYHWYKNHVLAGARQAHLPASYIAAIEQVDSVDDPNSARAARESGIYNVPTS